MSVVNDWWALLALWIKDGDATANVTAEMTFARASSEAEAIGLGFMRWGDKPRVSIRASKCPEPIAKAVEEGERT